MTNPYNQDDRKEMLKRYQDIGSGTGVVWGGIALAVLIALGAIFFFTSETGTNTAVSTGSGTTATSPANPGTGSGSPQGSSSTTGSTPSR